MCLLKKRATQTLNMNQSGQKRNILLKCSFIPNGRVFKAKSSYNIIRA